MVKEVVTIRVENKMSDDEDACFEAGRYLAYADQTNTIGQRAKVDNIHRQSATVYVSLTIPLLRGDDRTRFIREMENLARVRELIFVGKA